MDQWTGVVLAAGDGVRMNSRVSKVLHPVCGRELVRYPVELLKQMGIRHVTAVVSPGNGQAVRDLLGETVGYVTQPSPLGTGDALARAAELLQGKAGHLLVMSSDAPLVQLESVKQLADSHLGSSADMSLLTGHVSAAQAFGRVVRDQKGRVLEIVEAADDPEPPANPVEINGGIYCFRAAWLWDNVERIEPAPNGERYITSLAGLGRTGGANVEAVAVADAYELQGVNNRVQLSQVEAALRQRIRERWMLAGVTILDPASVFIDADATIGRDTVILPNTMVVGRSKIGEECQIGPGSVIRDSTLGNRCKVTASMLEEATLEDGVDMGPFSHLRPGAYLESGVHLGNFVEVKESRLAAGVAMGHFGYVGDAYIGAGVNVGAGMVTCNYDGKDKHRTVIEAGAFIGCDTMLVAPVTIGAEAVTGAGAVVTKDVPPGRLAVGVPAKLIEKRPKTN